MDFIGARSTRLAHIFSREVGALPHTLVDGFYLETCVMRASARSSLGLLF
jgi:hypothetical protein